MKYLSQWEHFKKNYMWPMVCVLGIFVTSLIMSIIRDDVWQFSFFFLGIALVFPIGNYFSWKKKYGDR